MTVEEALVVLLAAVAGILLFVGLSQALDDRFPGPLDKPHGPRRTMPPPPGATAAPSPSADPAEAPTERPAPSPTEHRSDGGG